MKRNNTYQAVCLPVLLLVFGAVSCNTGEPSPPSAEAVLETFEIAEGFQLELIAHEPLLADPVAMEIDEYGRMYVVQMHGYPLDKSGSGSVRLLSDTDGDGVMDESVTFVDGLMLPNGIMRWKEGILVTDAPYVLYFEDRDGDGKADFRDTVLTGFALSNPQHKVSTPIYGLDNWIYLANEPATSTKIYVDEFGDTGEKVHYPGLPDGPVLPQNANGRSVRFRPDRQELEMLSAATQYSNAQDSWGRHFLGNNTNHIYHEVVQARYLTRNPQLEVPSSTQTISAYGMPADVYPITENAEYQIFTSVGVFTSACGVNLYGGGLFPEPFNQVAFIAEPVSNIVHAARILENGATFSAERMYENQEFLASRDSWFRPVNHYVGPDGALYIVDYYRRYIEHPEWMDEEVVNSGGLYEGKEKGRIFRVVPKGTPAANWSNNLKLGDLSNLELSGYLRHPNSWYRRTAQRLLVDRRDTAIVPELRRMAMADTSAYGRLHASWTLEGLQALTVEVVKGLLEDPAPGNRENGILLAESIMEQHPGLVASLLELRDDPNDRVRFQLLCTLGYSSDPDVVRVREQLLFDHIEDHWMQVAALSAKDPDYEALLNRAIQRFDPASASQDALIERLTSMYANRSDRTQLKTLISKALNTMDQHRGAWQSAVLTGLANGTTGIRKDDPEFEAERRRLVTATFSHPNAPVRSGSLDLLKKIGLPQSEETEKAVERSVALVNDPGASAEDRKQAIEFLSIHDPARHQELFYELLKPNEPLAIQQSALRVLGKSEDVHVANYLRNNWKQLSPQLRDAAIGIFLSTPERTMVLIESLEANEIDPSSLDFYRQIHLMTLQDEDLRKRTRLIFKDESRDEQRREVIAQYKQALELKGDVANGSLVYQQNCAICHQIGGGSGTAFGPDLGTIRNRRSESILTDILDPALSIADGFDLWEIKLAGGESRQGIIATETPTAIALNIYGGAPEVISRERIESMRSLGVTIMPEGLEKAISIEQMADLIAFIKSPAQQKSNIPRKVTQSSDGTLSLHATTGLATGTEIAYMPEWDAFGWFRADCQVTWEVEVEKPGRYEAILDWSVSDEEAGKTFVLEAGDQQLTGKVGKSGSWETFKRESIGFIDLKSGSQQIVFRPESNFGVGALLDLREILLTPVSE